VLLKITILLALVGQLTGQGFKIFSRLYELVGDGDRVLGCSFVNTVYVALVEVSREYQYQLNKCPLLKKT